VFGKTQPVKGTTGYEGIVTDEKITAWLDPSPDYLVRARAGRGVRVDNVAIRHQLTAAIDIDQGYGSKNGVRQLGEWAAKHDLPPLPPTWSSTARGAESESRQYVYGIAEDARFKTKPCNSVELCCWHHRFTVCWPSVHPNTGGTYEWYLPSDAGVPPTWGPVADRIPAPGELAMLPDAWFRAFRGNVSNLDPRAITVEPHELLDTFRVGEPDLWVAKQIEKWSNEDEHLGHDETKNALITAFMLGREGHTGVRQLYEQIVRRFTTYVQGVRPKEAQREIKSLIEACATIAQQKPVRPVVINRMPSTDEFMAGAKVTWTNSEVGTDPATDDELESFVASFTANEHPGRLVRRLRWMTSDNPGRLAHHALYLVAGAIAGDYPAEDAVRALVAAHQHHQGSDPDRPRRLLTAALGAVLSAAVSA
jgi:hypothetical protein